MTTAVEIMNRNWYTFFQKLSSDKGGEYFTDEQKRLLFALEVLNRYEKSLATAQELRLSLIERQSKLRMQLAGITDDLRPESVDRFTVWRGTTDAEGVRNIRRRRSKKNKARYPRRFPRSAPNSHNRPTRSAAPNSRSATFEARSSARSTKSWPSRSSF